MVALYYADTHAFIECDMIEPEVTQKDGRKGCGDATLDKSFKGRVVMAPLRMLRCPALGPSPDRVILLYVVNPNA